MNILNRLGLYGMRAIEPVILAALITEEPLLLIGRHGTAKSLLLTRLARALGLEFRHYNASMINFDDIVGFPLPKDGAVEYVQTPASVWGAEAVFFDEVSRCRPDMQNRMFPIVHERMLMGMPLARLRYRWAAMNPPADEDGEDEYLGAEPLDPAFADRFVFIVKMPDWTGHIRPEQKAVILNDADAPIDDDAAAELRRQIAAGREQLDDWSAGLRPRAADYVLPLVNLLQCEAELDLSPRRANMLCRAVAAVQAAELAARAACGLEVQSYTLRDAALLALRHALPQPAQGAAVPEMKLIAAHREAWACAKTPPPGSHQALLAAADPVDRLALALQHKNLDRDRLSARVGDAFAGLTVGAQEAAAVHLFETGAAGRLNAAVAEHVGQAYAAAVFPRRFEQIDRPAARAGVNAARRATWPRIFGRISTLMREADRRQDARQHRMLANVLLNRFDQNVINSPGKINTVCDDWWHTFSKLRRSRPGRPDAPREDLETTTADLGPPRWRLLECMHALPVSKRWPRSPAAWAKWVEDKSSAERARPEWARGVRKELASFEANFRGGIVRYYRAAAARKARAAGRDPAKDAARTAELARQIGALHERVQAAGKEAAAAARKRGVSDPDLGRLRKEAMDKAAAAGDDLRKEADGIGEAYKLTFHEACAPFNRHSLSFRSADSDINLEAPQHAAA